MSRGAVDLFQQLAQNDFGFFQKLDSVGAIMTREVTSLTLDHTFEEARDVFRKGGFRHAPVEEDGDIIGVLSERDLLRHRPPLLGTAGEGDLDHRALQTPVSKMLTRNPIFVCEDDGPAVALSKMLENDVECVLVHTAQHQFAGILTSTDVLETVLLFHRVCGAPDLVRFRLVDLDMSSGMPLDMVFSRGARSVRDVMTKAPATVREGDALSAAMDRMQADEARNLVVVNDSGRVVGLLEDRDVLRTLPLPVPLFSVRESPTRFHERLFATEKGSGPTGSVGASMKKDPAHVRPDALFTDAIRTMMERDVSALPVLEDGALVGILSVTDVLRVVRVALQIGSLLGGSDAATTKAA